MPTPALLLLIATLLPLAGFGVLVFVGKRMGNPLAGWLGTAMIGASFLLSIAAMVSWYNRGVYHDLDWGFNKAPIVLTCGWVPVGDGINQATPGFLDVGIYVDSLTIAMFAMVTLVAALVHLFSIGYMHDDERFARFFTYLGLFCFAMLGLVLAATILQIFIFWELVGLCSYLLIGFWYEKKTASNAAIKAFIVNRIGDFGFMIGFGILFSYLGNVTLPAMWAALGGAGGVDGYHISQLILPGGAAISSTMLTAIGIGLFFGAVAKSAQFPLHVWLPDAMEGPTPVSALIHAATMVAAGVYLIGRIFPILTPDAKLFIAIIGCVTLTMAALIAVAQTDIKKVLAYSTISQLGYMMLALGVGSYVGGLFHLITHAFFKALLFLAAGSVIHAAGHEQEMSQFGGLMRKVPITAITFAVAVLAISATPFFSGYYSKDMILAHAGAFVEMAGQSGRSGWFWALFILPAIVTFITPFYMTRCWMLTFWGKPRNPQIYEQARELPILWLPLGVLAVLSVISGYHGFGASQLIGASMREATASAQVFDKNFHGFDSAWPAFTPAPGIESAAAATSAHDPISLGHALVARYAGWSFLIGIGIAFLIYLNGSGIAAALTRSGPLGWIRVWLYRRMYFDELYFAIIVNGVLAIAWIAAMFDQYVIDGLVKLCGWTVRQTSVAAGWSDEHFVDGAVNGIASVSQDLGAAVRAPQSGRIRMYVTILMAAVAIGLAVAIIAALS